MPKPTTLRRCLIGYLVLVALWIPSVAQAHGSIDEAGTWTNPPDKQGPTSIFIEARYYVTETHAIVSQLVCLQRKLSNGTWQNVDGYACVYGEHANVKGVYQSRYVTCSTNSDFRTYSEKFVKGDNGTIHLRRTAKSSVRHYDCT